MIAGTPVRGDAENPLGVGSSQDTCVGAQFAGREAEGGIEATFTADLLRTVGFRLDWFRVQPEIRARVRVRFRVRRGRARVRSARAATRARPPSREHPAARLRPRIFRPADICQLWTRSPGSPTSSKSTAATSRPGPDMMWSRAAAVSRRWRPSPRSGRWRLGRDPPFTADETEAGSWMALRSRSCSCWPSPPARVAIQRPPARSPPA